MRESISCLYTSWKHQETRETACRSSTCSAWCQILRQFLSLLWILHRVTETSSFDRSQYPCAGARTYVHNLRHCIHIIQNSMMARVTEEIESQCASSKSVIAHLTALVEVYDNAEISDSRLHKADCCLPINSGVVSVIVTEIHEIPRLVALFRLWHYWHK